MSHTTRLGLLILLGILACVLAAEGTGGKSFTGPVAAFPSAADAQYGPVRAHAEPRRVAVGSHAGTGHCLEDPNADGLISFGDIGLFTVVFGQDVDPSGEGLDIAPDLVGDGVVGFGDIGMVTQIFGQNCMGVQYEDTVGDPLSLDPFPQPFAYSCVFDIKVLWQDTTPAPSGLYIQRWQGRSHCMTVQGFPYTTGCFFGWQWLDQQGGTGWHLFAVTPTYWESAPSQYGGQYCNVLSTSGIVAPCGVLIGGYVNHEIHYGDQYGPLVHGPSHLHVGQTTDDFYVLCS